MREPYDLGMLIKELRTKAKMSQKELGARISRDKGVISRYESNYQTPPFETMRDFAAIFNVSMDYLAGFERSDAIQTFGLTEEQRVLLTETAEMLRRQNMNSAQASADEKLHLLGKITDCFFDK